MGIVSTPNDTSTIAGRATLVFALVVVTICGCDALLSTYRAKTELPQMKTAKQRIVLPYPYEKAAPIGVKTSADEGLLAKGDCEFVVPDVPKYVERLALGKSHTTGQFLGAQALMQAKSIQNLTKTFLPYIHHHAMIKHLFASKIGLYHASVWMIAGVANPSWELVASHLCPRPEYEFVQMCLHGFGHSGFVRLQHNAYADGYKACSYQQTVSWGHLPEAYMPCSAAPSTFLEYLCAHGFYHGVWEHMDTSLTPHMYPCVDMPGMPSYRFKTVCFTYIFMITAQADSGAGKGSEVMKSRQKVVLADGKKANGYLCGDLTGQDELHCLYGLAGQYNFNGYSTLYEEKAIAEFGLKPSTGWYHHYPFEDGYMHVDPITMGNDFKSLCFKLVPKGPIDDWDRWYACILGVPSYWVSHMFRHRSMSLPDRELGCSVFGNMTGTAVDAKTVFLCEKAVSLGYLSYPESRDAKSDEYGIFHAHPNQEQPSWAKWWNASIHDEKYKYYMSPWGFD